LGGSRAPITPIAVSYKRSNAHCVAAALCDLINTVGSGRGTQVSLIDSAIGRVL